ncbi:sensor domain-containing diguanylate cyclase [Hydrocarboniphaga sp.]|uniref:GGDEF domain-containing protein n=1 Tax=Hydrocarboniphaga sp. TaxID=2033016 RepID=UPI0026090512|nr:sensor domain-containing diguanylate cyclase [Hydrocarboniphaga sp.]
MPFKTIVRFISDVAAVEAGSEYTNESPARRRTLRAHMVLLAAASSAFDTLMLALLVDEGLGDAIIPIGYALVSTLCWGTFFLLLRYGWSERFADPYLTVAQILSAAAVEIGFSLLAPELAFYFLNHLFIVFAFGALRLSWRITLATWLGVSMATGVMLNHIGPAFTLPGENATQLALAWIALMSAILRCTFVGLYGNAVREKLIERNQQLAIAAARIEHLASDELTGALNRGPLWLQLEEQARRTAAAVQGFSVAMLDLDHFKLINDRFGHGTGDQVLKIFTSLVQGCLRPTDTLGRYGGEEFILVLPNQHVGSAKEVCERARRTVADYDWSATATGLVVTVSIGIANFHPSETVDEVVVRADHALYCAKHQGRNCVILDASAQ